jgi:hypothetical protein
MQLFTAVWICAVLLSVANTIPVGRVRQNVLPMWRWVSGIYCQNTRCHVWQQLNVNLCWCLWTNWRETDAVDSTQQTHVYSIYIAPTFCSIMIETCVWWCQHCAAAWRCDIDVWGGFEASIGIFLLTANKNVSTGASFFFHLCRLSLPTCPPSLNRSR